MTQRARELRAQGTDIVILSQGEPDFDTPENIRDAAKRAIDEGKTRYTPVAGVLPLREAICRKFRRDNNLDYEPDQITVGGGAKQVLTNALLATLNPGEEVLHASPCWTSYPDMIRIADGLPIAIDCTHTHGKITPKQLKAAITDKTRWLMLNSPSNPTGAVYSEAELVALGSVLREHANVWILSDDIYEHLVYTPGSFATIAEIVPDLRGRVVTVNGVSKAYAMTGWRIGYGAGPKWLIKAMNVLQSQMTSHASSIAQYAALEALEGPQNQLQGFVKAFRDRRDLVYDRLRTVDGLECGPKPDGAFYLFIGCRELVGTHSPGGSIINDDMELANYLLEEANVAVVPGSAFLARGFIRISFASSIEELEKACQRIASACRKLRSPEISAATSGLNALN